MHFIIRIYFILEINYYKKISVKRYIGKYGGQNVILFKIFNELNIKIFKDLNI